MDAIDEGCPCWRTPEQSPCCIWRDNTQACTCVETAFQGALAS